MTLQPLFLLMGLLASSVPTAPTKPITTTPSAAAKPNAVPAIPGVTLLKVGAGGKHEQGLIVYDPKKYGVPPAGGPHNQVWQNCGIYEKPVANEHAVHSLEHGAVWITYQPDLPNATLEKLKKAARDNPLVILSPYPKLPAPVVVTAWGAQKRYWGYGAEVLKFMNTYSSAKGSLAPEVGAPCQGGTNDVDTRI
jgi:hypothetical protein